eukprot:307588-Karenia_brevis.AAC.1
MKEFEEREKERQSKKEERKEEEDRAEEEIERKRRRIYNNRDLGEDLTEMMFGEESPDTGGSS